MSKKVFISYSSKDTDITKKICDHLETYGQSCWYSERDLDKSTNYWQDVLISELKNCTAVLLLVSKNAILSGEILNEISNASEKGKLIIPYFIQELSLPEKFEYYLKKYEWVPAYAMSENNALELLRKKLSIHTELKSSSVEIHTHKILKNEKECFSGINIGGYGIGYDKSLISNGFSGWSPSQIYIDYIDRNDFDFRCINRPDLEQQYEEFCLSGEYAKMVSRGNNKTRWMVTELYQNNDLYISLQKTEWSRTTFWWNKIKGNPDLQREMAQHTFHNQTPFFPNSLCLHLIVETADDKLLCTKVSYNKKNDYAFSIAATVGEQISETDFSSGETNNNRFVCEWCKRTFIEEFGFDNINYSSFVDEGSIRVLGINYEGDIYNFSLPVYVKLNLTYKSLLSYVANCAKSNDEYTEILALTKEEILSILENAGNKDTEKLYHPSTFLRFLMYLNYKYPGIINN